jgi:hypothetical protein
MLTCSTIWANAAVSARRGTAIRTSPQPARASRRTCSTQDETSVVGTFVIDWTTMGADEPISTEPTEIVDVCLLKITGEL